MPLIQALGKRAVQLLLCAVGLAVTSTVDAELADGFVAGFAERARRVGCLHPGEAPRSLLRVMTLNAAHGRSDGPNQLFLGKSTFERNLASISKLLRSNSADVVALQEVDGPSRWSGMFDHARSMAEDADYPFRYRADHARSWFFRYGTAVLSRLPLASSQSHRFAASPPSPRKGFVLSEVELPGLSANAAALTVDVVSVHFDFMSRRAQGAQLDRLADTVASREAPTIVLGDFNSDWHRPDSTVRGLAERTGLQAYQPDSPYLGTFQGKRIDWILISDEFRFDSYRVLTDVVSDHQPVLAEIGINPEGSLAPDCRHSTGT